MLINGAVGGGQTIPPSAGGGGGTVSLLESSDQSATVTNGAGPTVDLSIPQLYIYAGAPKYGVVGNTPGVDQTAALQSALDAAVYPLSGLSGNDVPATNVVLPTGHIKVGTLLFNANQSLEGQSPSGTYLYASSTTADVMTLKTGAEVQCTVRNLGIVGFGTPTAGNGINFSQIGAPSILGDTRHVIDNVVIVSTFNGVTLSGGTEVRIDKLTCQRVINIGVITTGTDNFFTNITIGQPGVAGIQLAGGNSRLWGSKVYGGGNGTQAAFLIVGGGRHEIGVCENQDFNGGGFSVQSADCQLASCISDSCSGAAFSISAVASPGGPTLAACKATKRAGGVYTPTFGGQFQNVAGAQINLTTSGCARRLLLTAGTGFSQSYFNVDNALGSRLVPYAATITPSPYDGGTVVLGTATGNLTVATPADNGVSDGSIFFPQQPLTIVVPVDATGGYSLSFGTGFALASSAPTLVASTHYQFVFAFDSDAGKWREVSRSATT